MTPLDAAIASVSRGWRVIPVPYRLKKPVLDGWPTLRLDVAELAEHFNGKPSNIGALLGEPSRGLTDIDLDIRETLELADQFLPRTECEFGRDSKPRSHRLYYCDPLAAT